MPTKTKPKPKRKPSRDTTIATALGDEQYGPQVSAVQDLFRQAKRQYAGDVDAAKANAAATIAAVRSSRQPTRDIYAEAKRSSENTASDIDASVASRLGTPNPVSNTLSASIARERGTQANRVSNERAGALNELQQREVGAQAGRQLGVNQARSEYGTTRDTLSQKLEDIMGQRGAKIASELGKLQNKREETAAKGADIYSSPAFAGYSKADIASMGQAGRQKLIDAYNAEKTKGKKGGKGYRATSEMRIGLADKVKNAVDIAGEMKAQGGLPRNKVESTLRHGSTPAKGSDQKGVPKFGDFAATLAADLAWDGYISDANVKKLHELGYKVSDLPGAIGPAEHRKRKAKQQETSSKYGWGQ
jgi:hypothetical protein